MFITVHRYPPLFARLRRWLFGDPLHAGTYIPVTFKGWKDADLAKLYKHSVNLYETEISARRAGIRYPSDILEFRVVSNETEAGTVPGTELAVFCYPNAIAKDYVKKFLEQAGLEVE